METKKTITSEQEEGAKKYPGGAYDIADDEKVTEKLVKDQVKIQNNNPRNAK